MPCFSSAPDKGTPEYVAWRSAAEPEAERFVHVVEYYYGKAEFSMPQPDSLQNIRAWLTEEDIPADTISPVSDFDNRCVLRQILLHLDCDGVDVFQLNRIGNLFISERSPVRLGYAFVVNFCFRAMRKHEV